MGDELDDFETAVPVPAGSPLARMRAQRERIAEQVEELHVPVPRTTDPAIWVAYRPVDPDVMNGILERRQKDAKKAKGDVKLTLANADVLVKHCIGIYWLDDDDKEHGWDPAKDGRESWLDYGPELAAALGIEATTAVEACRALFGTDADLSAHTTELLRQSGLSMGEFEERYRGE